MNDWFRRSTAAVGHQSQWAQKTAAFVNERVMLPTFVAMSGPPDHACHPTRHEPGVLNRIKRAAYTAYAVILTIVRGADALECEHSDHQLADENC